jgi:RNA polymerase sigma-70 factor, ECF subfamily
MAARQRESHDAPLTEALDISTVFRRHSRDVERWAARLGGPLVDSEDVAQEVFMVVQRRLPHFERNASVTTWLYKITQNIATSRRRRERFRRWLRGAPLDYARDLPAPGPSPIDEMERREAAAEVYAALDSLGDKYRSLVILFEIEGLSGEEISVLTGIPLPTVWIRLHRGRKRFRSYYQEMLGKRGQR